MDAANSIDRIVKAAIDEFGALGFDAGTMDGVAQRACISKQLVYHYFKNKSELYSHVVEHVSDQDHLLFSATDFDTLAPEAALEKFLNIVADANLQQDHKFGLDQMMHDGTRVQSGSRIYQSGRKTIQILDAILARGRKAGLFHPDIDARELFLTAILLASGYMAGRKLMSKYIGFEEGRDDSVETWRRHMLTVCMRGILTTSAHLRQLY